MAAAVRVFGRCDTPAEAGAPQAGRVVSGAPRFLTRNHYSDPTAQFHSGEWSAGPGAWRVAYEPHEEEFCMLLEGRVTLTADDGTATELAAGDAFVVPGGFSGVWHNHTEVRKLYAIMHLQETPP